MLRCLLRGPLCSGKKFPHTPRNHLAVKLGLRRARSTFSSTKNPILGADAPFAAHRLVHGSSRRHNGAKLTDNSPNFPEKLRGGKRNARNVNQTYKEPYLRDTSFKMHDIERVLASPALANEILDKIYHGTLSAADNDSMRSLVRSAVEYASSTYSREAYDFLIDAWHIVFFERKSTESLQDIRQALQQNEDRLIHMMINRGDYPAYESLIAPLYQSRPASLKSWAMTLAETLRPQMRDRNYTCDHREIRNFLGSQRVSREQKHRLIAIFATKTLLAGKSQQNVANAVSGLLEFFPAVEDAFSLSDSQFLHIYKRPLTLLGDASQVTVKERIEKIHEIFVDRVSTREFSDFLSAWSRVTAQIYPQTAISCWQYKQSVLNGHRDHAKSPMSSDFRTETDLASTMLAYISLRAYDKALVLYSAHPHLQNDSQITHLLRASEKSKDWKLLQKQFEDMYGRGNLPYVVHYSVVMGALASLGSTTEVEQLYAQLLRRKLAPTASIYLALIRSNINANKLDVAEKWYGTVMEVVSQGLIEKKHAAALQLEIFEAKLPSMTAATAVAELTRLADESAELSVPLINTHTIRTMIRFVSSLYSLEGFEAVWSLAKRLSLIDDDLVCSEALSFLTKMGQFTRAEELANAAQLDSPVPFQNSLILACQMRNYRQWRKEISDRETRRLLSERISRIMRITEKGEVSPKHLDRLLEEIIKQHTSMGRPEDARPFLDKANAANISSERHFVPFLKQYSKEGSYDDNSDVLNLYQEMVSRKTPISARTYYYLSKSLLMIDTANKNGHENSFNLLQSVLEMYGFSLLGGHSTNKVSVADLSRNAVFLLQIVSNYATEVSARNEETMDLVLNFLKQIREKLDKNIDYGFRVSILTEMSKVYRVYGDLQVAGSLVNSALKEMDDIVDQLPKLDPVPKLLQLDYRKTVDIKVSVLAQSGAPPVEYESLLQSVLSRNVRLSGYQIHNLSLNALSGHFTQETVRCVLGSCERFLVSGNWAEVKLSRKIHFIYRMFLVYMGRTMSPEAISSRYDILNKLYDISDVAQTLRDHAYVRNPKYEIEKALAEYVEMNPLEPWTPDTFFEDLAGFFTPERKFESRHHIQPNLAAALVSAIERLCDGDQSLAFTLYDEYPEVMEYLLFFVGERTRVVKFRMGISKLLGSTGADAIDGREARRQRSIEALQELWGQESHDFRP
ncbi:hypothetical protein OXX80_000360 [Metschnikowia pulcherrima]